MWGCFGNSIGSQVKSQVPRVFPVENVGHISPRSSDVETCRSLDPTNATQTVQSPDLPTIPFYSHHDVTVLRSDYKECGSNAFLMAERFPYIDRDGGLVICMSCNEEPKKVTLIQDQSGNKIRLEQDKERPVPNVRALNLSSGRVMASDFLGRGHVIRARKATEITSGGNRDVALLTVNLVSDLSPPLGMVHAQSISRPGKQVRIEFGDVKLQSSLEDLQTFQMPKRLDPQYVAQVDYGYVEKKSKADQSVYFRYRLVMPLLTPLSEFKPESSNHATRIALHMVRGLRYLHSQNIIHGDIKPQNILCDSKGVPKYTDFDLSLFCSSRDSLFRIKGATKGFAAPELHGRESLPRVTFEQAVATDTFSLGRTLDYLFSFPEKAISQRFSGSVFLPVSSKSCFSNVQREVACGLGHPDVGQRMELETAEKLLAQFNRCRL